MSEPPLVLHLNGAPGVGKSTIARRWAEEHPGTLLLEVDALRTWVSGWREDFVAVGAPVREVALAMLGAWVGEGHDVVLPQLVASTGELARFRDATTRAGGRFVEMVLAAPGAEADDRFHARERDEATTPWLVAVHVLVAEAGPDHLPGLRTRLDALVAVEPEAVVVPSVGGEPGTTYDAVVAAVAAAIAGDRTNGATDGREGPASGIPR